MKIIISESAFLRLFEAASLEDIYQKYYSKIPQDAFNQIIQSDPTYNQAHPNKMGKFGKWLLSLYSSNRLKLEDLYKAKEYLSYFVKFNNVIEEKDINKYKSLQDLYRVVETYIENPDQATSKQDAVRKAKEGAEKVYEDSEWMIIVPHTQEASCYYGKGTQWCTAADKSDNMFDSYNEQGNLYININKRTQEKYQFHFETNSFMDSTDAPIEPPIYKEIGLSDGALKWYMKNVDEWREICTEKIEILGTDRYGDNLISLQREYGESFWRVVERDDYQSPIATEIINNRLVDDATETLEDDGYAVFDNAYGYKTLITYDVGYSSCYLISYKIKSIGKVDNDFGDNGMTQSVVSMIDAEGGFELMLVPDGITLYKAENESSISGVRFVRYDIIAVYKKNNLVDLVNYEGNIIEDVQLIYDEIEQDEDDWTYGYVLDKNGEKIRINVENLEIV